MFEIPPVVMQHFLHKLRKIRLLSYDADSKILIYEIVAVPGTRISYNCEHLLMADTSVAAAQ